MVSALWVDGELADDFAGGGVFNWDVVGSQLRVQGGAFSMSADVAGFGPLTITDADVGVGGTTTFDYGEGPGGSLILSNADGSNGNVWFPRVFLPV